MAENLSFDDFLTEVPCMATELARQLEELDAQVTGADNLAGVSGYSSVAKDNSGKSSLTTPEDAYGTTPEFVHPVDEPDLISAPVHAPAPSSRSAAVPPPAVSAASWVHGPHASVPVVYQQQQQQQQQPGHIQAAALAAAVPQQLQGPGAQFMPPTWPMQGAQQLAAGRTPGHCMLGMSLPTSPSNPNADAHMDSDGDDTGLGSRSGSGPGGSQQLSAHSAKGGVQRTQGSESTESVSGFTNGPREEEFMSVPKVRQPASHMQQQQQAQGMPMLMQRQSGSSGQYMQSAPQDMQQHQGHSSMHGMHPHMQGGAWHPGGSMQPMQSLSQHVVQDTVHQQGYPVQQSQHCAKQQSPQQYMQMQQQGSGQMSLQRLFRPDAPSALGPGSRMQQLSAGGAMPRSLSHLQLPSAAAAAATIAVGRSGLGMGEMCHMGQSAGGAGPWLTDAPLQELDLDAPPSCLSMTRMRSQSFDERAIRMQQVVAMANMQQQQHRQSMQQGASMHPQDVSVHAMHARFQLDSMQPGASLRQAHQLAPLGAPQPTPQQRHMQQQQVVQQQQHMRQQQVVQQQQHIRQQHMQQQQSPKLQAECYGSFPLSPWLLEPPGGKESKLLAPQLPPSISELELLEAPDELHPLPGPFLSMTRSFSTSILHHAGSMGLGPSLLAPAGSDSSGGTPSGNSGDAASGGGGGSGGSNRRWTGGDASSGEVLGSSPPPQGPGALGKPRAQTKAAAAAGSTLQVKPIALKRTKPAHLMCDPHACGHGMKQVRSVPANLNLMDAPDKGHAEPTHVSHLQPAQLLHQQQQQQHALPNSIVNSPFLSSFAAPGGAFMPERGPMGAMAFPGMVNGMPIGMLNGGAPCASIPFPSSLPGALGMLMPYGMSPPLQQPPQMAVEGMPQVPMPKPRKRSQANATVRAPAPNPNGHACTQCGTQVTPVWRAGPHGPKTLCNACGVRWMKVVKGGPPAPKKQ